MAYQPESLPGRRNPPHLDAIDLDELRNQQRAEPMAVAENSLTRSAVQRTLTQEERLRRAQTLARKINLLLDARTDESGQSYGYPAIEAGAEKAGFSLSRTRWSLLKNGKDQVVPNACLRAIAKVFDVDPEYLLHDDAELPTDVEAVLPQVRIKRLFRLRDSVVKELGGPVDPEGLKAITKMLDQAIQQ